MSSLVYQKKRLKEIKEKRTKISVNFVAHVQQNCASAKNAALNNC